MNPPYYQVSARLKLALLKQRAAGVRVYDIARRAGLHHTTVSLLMHDALRLKPKDRRVLALARVLGVPQDRAFEKEKGE